MSPSQAAAATCTVALCPLLLPALCHSAPCSWRHHWLRLQRSIGDKLKPIEVDASDKSVKAYLTRARNAALKGVNHDIHDEITDDVDLTAVRVCCCQQQ